MTYSLLQAYLEFWNNSGGGGIAYGGTGTSGQITGNVTGGSGTGSSYTIEIYSNDQSIDSAPGTQDYSTNDGLPDGSYWDENGNLIYVDIVIRAPVLRPGDAPGYFESIGTELNRLEHQFDQWLYGSSTIDPTDWLYETYGEHFSEGHVHIDPLDGNDVGENSTGEVSSYAIRINFGSRTSDSVQGSGLILLGAGNDSAVGSAGIDILDGGSGNDVLSGGAGGDVLVGGPGVDTASYVSSASGIVLNLSTGRGTGGDAQGDQLVDIEHVVGSAYSDTIIVGNTSAAGFDAADYFVQNPDVYNDAIARGLGDAYAYYHWVNGGRFEGRLGGWDGATRAVGADWGTLFSVGEYLKANPDVAAYKAANGLSDQWVYEHWLYAGRQEGRAGGLDASGAVIDAGAGNDFVAGGVYSDYLVGGVGNDTLDGYTGDDVLLGGAGRDSLNGGEGRDQIFGGNDDDFLAGANGDDSLEGGSGNDQIYGNMGHDLLRGNAGNDKLDGGEGDGFDTLEGGDGQDDLAGWGGNDVLRGEAGDDVLSGCNGNDVLTGGAGSDTLFGGAGRDAFEFHSGRDGQGGPWGLPPRDVIKDFQAGETIRIDGAATVSAFHSVVFTGLTQYRVDTIITVDNKWQIVLEGYGGNVWWNAADHMFIS